MADLRERIAEALTAAYDRNNDDIPGYVAAIADLFEHVGFVSDDCGPGSLFYERAVESRFPGDTPVYRLVASPTKADLLKPHGSLCAGPDCLDHPAHAASQEQRPNTREGS